MKIKSDTYWIGGMYNTRFIVTGIIDDVVHYKRTIKKSPTYMMCTETFLHFFRPETKLERYLN